VSHWSQYRHRGRGRPLDPIVSNPPAAGDWRVDMDAAPLTTWHNDGAFAPPHPTTMQFAYYRLSDPATLFLTTGVDEGDETNATLDPGEAWGSRARWTDNDGVTPLSGWSSQKTFNT
jgi:hypothetical protein